MSKEMSVKDLVERSMIVFDIDNINAVSDYCQHAIQNECMTNERWDRFVERIRNTSKDGRVPEKGVYQVTIVVRRLTEAI